MKREPKWITRLAAVALHEWLLAEHGGLPGIRDEGLLDAALASPRNRHLYSRTDILELAAAYAFAISRNHPFVDGNKRLALTLMGVFMEENGFRFDAPEPEAAHAIRALAAGTLSEAVLLEWLRANASPLRRTPSKRRKRK